MKQSEVTYDDSNSRDVVKRSWKYTTGIDLTDGVKYGVDLVSDDYAVEVEYSCVPIEVRRNQEYRLLKRKIHYWDNSLCRTGKNKCEPHKQKTHFVTVYSNFIMVWANSNIRKWIDKYKVGYRKVTGWKREDSYFLLIPPHEENLMRFYKEDSNGIWRKVDVDECLD